MNYFLKASRIQLILDFFKNRLIIFKLLVNNWKKFRYKNILG